MAQKKDSWSGSHSYLDIFPGKDGYFQLQAQLEMGNGVLLRITGKEQKKGEGVIRGKMSIVSLKTGRPLNKVGRELQRALERRKSSPSVKEDMPDSETDVAGVGEVSPHAPDVDAKNESADGSAKEEQKKKGEPSKPLPRTIKAIFLHSTDPEVIKAELLKKAEKFVSDNILSVQGMVNTIHFNPAVHDMSVAVQKYANAFLDLQSQLPGARMTETTRKDKERALKRGAAKLIGTPLADLTPESIKQVQKSDKKLSKRELKLMNEFWSYLSLNRVGLQDSPFREGLDAVSKASRKDTDKLILQKGKVNHITEEDERKLNEKILPLVKEDSRVLGVFLAKDGGISGEMCAGLTWSDVLFDPEDYYNVRLRLSKNNIGAVHDYTRPVFPLLAAALHIRYDALLQKYPRYKLTDLYVVSNDCFKGKNSKGDETEADDPGEEKTEEPSKDGEGASKKLGRSKRPMPGEISDFNRQILKATEVTYAYLTRLKKEKQKEAAGTRLLLDTYRYKLENRTGLLPDDPAAISFLRTLSLASDITSNNYRSFTCLEGEKKLLTALRRVGLNIGDKLGRELPYTKPPVGAEGEYHEEVFPRKRADVAELSTTYLLNPGEFLQVRGQYGVQGRLIAKKRGAAKPQDVVPAWTLQHIPPAISEELKPEEGVDP